MLCILLAPLYVTLAGTRISILTSYACHIFFVSTYLWAKTKLLLISSAVLGLGTALGYVAQGKCLVENKNSEKINIYISNFWFNIEIFLFAYNFDFFDLIKMKYFQNISKSTINGINIFFMIFSFSFFFLIKDEETNEYKSGGVECIPNNGKFNESEQTQNKGPFFNIRNLLKTMLHLLISWKMLLICFIAAFTGQLSNTVFDVSYDFPMSVRYGEICGVLFYSFCIYKKSDSLNITYVGYIILSIFVYIGSTLREISLNNEPVVRIYFY